jgi:hypothetical protein
MVNGTRQIVQSLAVLLGGSVLGVIGADLIDLLPWARKRLLGILAGLATVLILWGSGSLDAMVARFHRALRRRRFRSPMIGVLSALSSSDKISIEGVNTSIPPSEWVEEIRKASAARQATVRVRLVFARDIHDGYAAIVNPFGATYPESSFDGYPVYQSLLSFVRRGGLFVNVADLPTYYAFNPLLRRSIDRTPAIYEKTGGEHRLFTRVPLLEELGIRVWNSEAMGSTVSNFQLNSNFASCGPSQLPLVVSRLAKSTGINLDPVLSPEKIDDGGLLTPLWMCRYGEGQVLASLSFLNEAYPQNRALLPLIANIVVQQVT